METEFFIDERRQSVKTVLLGIQIGQFCGRKNGREKAFKLWDGGAVTAPDSWWVLGRFRGCPDVHQKKLAQILEEGFAQVSRIASLQNKIKWLIWIDKFQHFWDKATVREASYNGGGQNKKYTAKIVLVATLEGLVTSNKLIPPTLITPLPWLVRYQFHKFCTSYGRGVINMGVAILNAHDISEELKQCSMWSPDPVPLLDIYVISVMSEWEAPPTKIQAT